MMISALCCNEPVDNGGKVCVTPTSSNNKGEKAMAQEMTKLALQNLGERLRILEEIYQRMFDPNKAEAETKEQKQMEMWSE